MLRRGPCIEPYKPPDQKVQFIVLVNDKDIASIYLGTICVVVVHCVGSLFGGHLIVHDYNSRKEHRQWLHLEPF